MTKHRVLLAASSEGALAVARVFPEQTELHIVDEWNTAEERARYMEYDAIFIGFFFDGYRMLQLIKSIRERGANTATPIVCFRPYGSALVRSLDGVVAQAAKTLGADEYWDLSALAFGEFEEKQARMRVEQFLMAPAA